MAFSVVRRSHAFAGNPHKFRIQLAVGILIMEHGYGVSARPDPGKLADCLPLGNCGTNVCRSFFALFWKTVAGRVQGAEYLALVTVQPNDFNMDGVGWTSLRLGLRASIGRRKSAKKKHHSGGDWPQVSPPASVLCSW